MDKFIYVFNFAVEAFLSRNNAFWKTKWTLTKAEMLLINEKRSENSQMRQKGKNKNNW